MTYCIVSYIVTFMFLSLFYHLFDEVYNEDEKYWLQVLAVAVFLLSPITLPFCGIIVAASAIGVGVLYSAKTLNRLIGKIHIKFVKDT